MPRLDKDHGRKIAKKLRANIDKTPKAHDLACVYQNGILVASFGIRRGSRKSLGHGHIAADLHVSRRDALRLATCSLSRESWVEMMIQQGWIEADPT